MHIINTAIRTFKYATIQVIYKCIYFNIQINFKIQD